MAETTKNPIWKGDNFGSPKITTKYLNYTGLADFWSRAKTYIDEQDASRNGQNIPLYPRGTESNKSITTAIEDLSNTVNNIPQSDWNEIDESSAAFIKNKTHGTTTIDVRSIGSYTHINDITHIKHNGNIFQLELGVKTQINGGPSAWVTLTSPNTILIEEASPGWISAYPVSIIDIQKLDVKYLPDDVLNVNYLAGIGLSLDETTFNLKKASATELGGVKVGANLSIDDNGVLSAIDKTRVTIEYLNGTLNMSNVNEIDYNAGTLNLTL